MSQFSKIFDEIKDKGPPNSSITGGNSAFPIEKEVSIVDNDNRELETGEDIMKVKKKDTLTSVFIDDECGGVSDEILTEDCELPAVISTKEELLQLIKVFPNSRYIQTIKDSIENGKEIKELDIPALNNDEEAKLFHRNISTTNTKIIDGSSTLSFSKIDGQDFSDSLDILDSSNELPMSSWYGRFFTLLAVTISPIYIFNICTLIIIYGRDFFNACVIVSFLICIPFMYLEILIGQFTVINISSFFSKMAPAWNMVRFIFTIMFYVYGVYSLIYCIYYMTESLIIEEMMTNSELDINKCPEDSPGICTKSVLAYYCLYAPKQNKYFEQCQMFYEAFEKLFYYQDSDKMHSSKYLDKSEYIYAIIPTKKYHYFTYPSCFIVWVLITFFKKNGYANNSGLMLIFYTSYIISLFGLFFSISYRKLSLTDASYFLASHSKSIYDIPFTVWILATYHMFITFKTGHGIIMKISSFFPTSTNNIGLPFLVGTINTIVLMLHVFIWLCFYGSAISGDKKDHFLSSMTMDKRTTITYLSSSLLLFVERGEIYEKIFAFLLSLSLFGISAYQAFIYIDLLDCEIHNMGIKHSRYVTTRYKTTAAMTLLFLLVPIFSTSYPIVGEMFLITEESLKLKTGLCFWQLLLIFFGIGYEKIRFPCVVKIYSHILKFFCGIYIKFIVIPVLGFLFCIATVLEDGREDGWLSFIRETSDPFYNYWIHFILLINSYLCIMAWPLFQMLRAIFYGKRPTSIFKCQLAHTKE
uniref:Transmembrane protein n=1 Tax=Strongyloides venezuelensis TaxID=75913 RepID=A0A0K0G218_STRVS